MEKTELSGKSAGTTSAAPASVSMVGSTYCPNTDDAALAGWIQKREPFVKGETCARSVSFGRTGCEVHVIGGGWSHGVAAEVDDIIVASKKRATNKEFLPNESWKSRKRGRPLI